ncbi:uncharacterized protein LOC123269052 [Cotesia glomerata]|uniref:uncharacterized protein LOC123269052 n=1 Tax=Cotesia glomerata TaxID=32391 RepID=UPI001D005B41|nr:uncharacterized protein LOC123269052 [Cotesia glomerata]
MQVNERKCVVISFSKSQADIQYPYTINEIALNYVSSCRDLGVIFDNHLSFTNHYAAIAASALKTLRFVIRMTKNFKNLVAIKALYSALVRPKLEYASVIWSPTYKKHIQSLEIIQRKFIKYLVYKKTGDYPVRGTDYLDLCRSTNMLTLEERRKCAAVLFVMGVCRSLIHSPNFLSLLPIKLPSRNLRSSNLFHLPLVRSTLAQASPLYRLSAICNFVVANNNDEDLELDLFGYNQPLTPSTLTSIILKLRDTDT